MIKDIKYSGYSAVPSDYECPDGQLALSLNLICEDGALKPLPKPDTLFDADDDESIFYIHNVSGIDHFIFAKSRADGRIDIMYREAGGPPQGHASNPIIFSCISVSDVCALGNVLAFAVDSGLVYVIWRDGEYVFLGARPELPAFCFGLERSSAITADNNIEIAVDKEVFDAVANSLPGASSPAASRPHQGHTSANKIDRFFEDISNAIYGRIFDGYSRISSDGDFKFYQPFFVRYAFRLFDGSYLWHSSPVLMLPTSIPPLVYSDSGTWADGVYKSNLDTSDVFTFSLLFKTILPGNLKLWKDIVTDVDFFVSAPLYTFDQSKSVSGYGKIDYQKTKSYGHTRGRLGNKYSVTKCRRLDGIFRSSPNDVFDWHFVSNADCWILPSRESDLLEDVRSNHTFYRIARLNVNDIPEPSESFVPLHIENGVTPDSLVARPSLPDDFISMHALSPNVLHSYNNRLHIADFYINLAPAPPLAALACASSADADNIAFTPEVSYRKDANSLKAVRASSVSDRLPSPELKPPVFIYIPDADADCLSVYSPSTDPHSSTGYDFPLTRHDFLNGAFFFSGFNFPADGSLMSHFDAAYPVPEPLSPRIIRHSSVYVSEVNNPFVFSPLTAFSVGDGKVLALASAAKALSQGQFGQFPLYAFTDRGVWATELSSSGSYSARQPITRDVCINPKAITSIDSAVLFPTHRGIMLLAGSQTLCITDTINAVNPFDVLLLPGMDNLHSLINHDADSCLPTVPFLEFLPECGMLYDYVHQRVIVYNPNYSYAYVYSLKSKDWGMIYSSIASGINAYPEALAIDHDGALLNFSAMGGESTKGLLVSRPLKLETPDILKTIDTVIQRGHFQKGHVQAVLYGSRDLFNWNLVWSSKDHYLRGFRGTPYKYFRIACVTSLSEDECIFGASLQFTPRLTNQPR